MAGRKGSPFERLVCGQLDMWWTGREDVSVFWRSSQSGGRATTRKKKGKKTHGSHGDVAAVHPCGEPLIDVLTLELKRGYPKHHPSSIFDTKDVLRRKEKIKQFEEFIDQARTSHLAAGSLSWMVIHQRDRRESMCYCEEWFYKLLREYGGFAKRPVPFMFMACRTKDDELLKLTGFRFSAFMEGVTRKVIENISKEC